MYDVVSLRAHFPALAKGAAHFDGPGGSQVPDVVADTIRDTLTAGVSNRGSVTPAERFADDIVLQARLAMADLLGADPRGIAFGRSMTQLTFDMSRTLAKTWRPGDEVVVTRLDHDANIRPWLLAAEAVGAVVRWADFDAATGELPVQNIALLLSARTRLVAVTGASNLIGTRPELMEICRLAQEHEDGLRRAVEDGLAALPGVRVHSGAGVRTPTLLLTFDGRDAWKAYEFLAMLDINAPAGSFYALEASRYLGLGDGGGLRVGLAPYSDQRDVDRLLAALAEFLAVPPDSMPVTT